MELTGNTLKDFWIWYLLPRQRKTYKTSSLRGGNNVAMIRFLAMSFAERYGVFVDYFDSVGVDIEICKYHVSQEYYYMINDGDEENRFETRPEARTAAIEKADELRNEVLNK